MICLRHGLFIPRNLVKYVNQNVYRYKSLLCTASSLQESSSRYFIRNQSSYYPAEKTKESNFPQKQSLSKEPETSEKNEESETLNSASEYLPFMDPEILQINNSMDLKKFISENMNSLTPDRIVNILNKYHYFLVKEKWTNLKKLKITDSKEFHAVLENLHKHYLKIDVNELVKILTFLGKMGISNNSQLVKAIINHLIKNVNRISFIKSAMLYHHFTFEKIHKDFRENLKISIEKKILENSDKMTDNEILKAIYYAGLNQFSLECNIKLLNVILDAKSIFGFHTVFGNYLKILRKIPKNHPIRSELELNFYKLLEELKTHFLVAYNFCGFMHIYGNDVHFGDAEYRPKLVDDIIDGIMSRKMNLKSKISCLEGLMIMKHIRHDYIKQVKDLILAEKEVLNDSFNLMAFSKALANSHYCSVMPNESLEIKNLIEGLEILNNTRKWKEVGLNLTLSMAVYLLSMGLYFPRFFTSLSEECNSNTKIFESNLGRLKIMLLINEALLVLHPKHASRFLTQEKVSQMVKKTKMKTMASEERKKWILDTKTLLESSVGQGHCVLHKCHTKMGQEIDFVVAVDEDGNPFDFSRADIKDTDCCIEDFNLPSKCKLILVLVVAEKEFNRNVKTLTAMFTLKLKTMKTMGYRTLTIPHDEWTNVPENEKGPYFWDLVKAKRNDLCPNPSYEFIGKKIINVEKEGLSENNSDEIECS